MTREQSPAPPSNSNSDWTSPGQHERLPELRIVTRESLHNSRKTTRFPRHRDMRPFPAAASQEKSHVHSLNSKQYLTPLMQPQKFPNILYLLKRTLSFPAALNLRPFSPPDLDMRINFHASSGKGSRPSLFTSGGGRAHTETPEEASWVMPHSNRHQFPHPIKISPDVQAPLRM